jgi:hypothetical protein
MADCKSYQYSDCLQSIGGNGECNIWFPQFKSHKKSEAIVNANSCKAEINYPLVIGQTRILEVNIIDGFLCVQDWTFTHIQLTFHCGLFLKKYLKIIKPFWPILTLLQIIPIL